jgi:hypothetical protein
MVRAGREGLVMRCFLFRSSEEGPWRIAFSVLFDLPLGRQMHLCLMQRRVWRA